jgi:hypothetical protein
MNKTIVKSQDENSDMFKFINNLKSIFDIHNKSDAANYQGLKIRMRAIIDISKTINANIKSVFSEMPPLSGVKFLSTTYLKMHELIEQSKIAFNRDYVSTEKNILKIKKLSIRLRKHSRKTLNNLFDLMADIDKNLIANYELIESYHNKLQSNYYLRKEKVIYYGEEDENFDDPNDTDYIFEEDNDDDEEIKFDNDNDSGYAESNNDEDEHEEINFKEDDNDSEYTPSEDEDEDDDEEDEDEVEEDEVEDEECEDEVEDEECEDKQLISDYLNDPDYNPDEEEEDEDDLEYDYNFLNKKVDDNGNIILKAGIDNDDEDSDFEPSEEDEEEEDEEDDEEEDEDIKHNNNKNMVNICKRRFENNKVVYRWVKMTKDEADKKYDEDYVCEEN